jgi:hypothetical protein
MSTLNVLAGTKGVLDISGGSLELRAAGEELFGNRARAREIQGLADMVKNPIAAAAGKGTSYAAEHVFGQTPEQSEALGAAAKGAVKIGMMDLKNPKDVLGTANNAAKLGQWVIAADRVNQVAKMIEKPLSAATAAVEVKTAYTDTGKEDEGE